MDGQLSTYTGLSLTGPVSIAGMSLSGGASHSNSHSNSAGMGSYSTERVATPPPLGSHSYSNRPKQTTGKLLIMHVFCIYVYIYFMLMVLN